MSDSKQQGAVELPPLILEQTDLTLARIAIDEATAEEISEPTYHEFPEYHCRERQLRDALIFLRYKEAELAQMKTHLDAGSLSLFRCASRAESAEAERDKLNALLTDALQIASDAQGALAAVDNALSRRPACAQMDRVNAIYAACEEAARSAPAIAKADQRVKQMQVDWEDMQRQVISERAALAVARAENVWISVEERLPNVTNGMFLCVYLYRGHPGHAVCAWYGEKFRMLDQQVPKVTHWRPLPQPPAQPETATQL